MRRLRAAAGTALLIGGLWAVLAVVGAASGVFPECSGSRGRDEKGAVDRDRGASDSARPLPRPVRDGDGEAQARRIGNLRGGASRQDASAQAVGPTARRFRLCDALQQPLSALQAGNLVGDAPAELVVGCGEALTILSFVRSGGHRVPVRVATYRMRPRDSDFRAAAGVAATGDVDGDGNRDLVAPFAYESEQGRRGRTVLVRARSQRAFAAPRTFDRAPVRAAAIADLDGRKGLDIVLVAGGRTADRHGTVRVFRGGDGSAPQRHARLEAPKEPSALAVVDLDRDGALDLVLGSPRHVVVHFGTRQGRFEDPHRLDHTTGSAFAVGDLDGDGHDDVVGGDEPPKLLRAGSRALEPEGLSSSRRGAGPLRLQQVVDIDRDGRADILAARPQAVVMLVQAEDMFFRERLALRATRRVVGARVGTLWGDEAPELLAVVASRDGRSGGAELLVAQDVGEWPVQTRDGEPVPIDAAPMAVEVEVR